MTGKAIEMERVTKRFGGFTAVDDLTLHVAEGSVVALLGPNGAGKTTSVSMMLGLLSPTNGQVRLLGGDPRDPRNRERVGAMLQDVSVIERLRVTETIDLFRSYYAKPLDTKTLLRISGLEEKAKAYATSLSGGMKRRLNFALALAGDPQVLFIDEPTVGMDVTSRKLFWETLRDYANGGRTIVLTTHYLEEADAIADRIVVIDKGKKRADGTPGELKSSFAGNFVSFVAGAALTQAAVQELPGVEDVEWSGRHVRLRTRDSDRLLWALFEQRLDVSNIEVRSAGLDDVFAALTDGETEEKTEEEKGGRSA
jgi:ABC-2 type transport system ATP-binding protein